MTKRFAVRLQVRPRDGVRDPQGAAVQEALHQAGYTGVSVAHVGRTLRLHVDAASQQEAQAIVADMGRRLLVNPNLETCEIVVEA